MLTINPLVQVSRRRRDSTSYWASSSSVYNIIASYGTRSNDVRRFPTYRSYLWANKYGASKAYAHFGAGAFAGYNSNCHYKVRLCVCVCVCVHAFGIPGRACGPHQFHTQTSVTVSVKLSLPFSIFSQFSDLWEGYSSRPCLRKDSHSSSC